MNLKAFERKCRKKKEFLKELQNLGKYQIDETLDKFSASSTAPPIFGFHDILFTYTRAKEGLENFGISGIIIFQIKASGGILFEAIALLEKMLGNNNKHPSLSYETRNFFEMVLSSRWNVHKRQIQRALMN